MSDFSNIYTTLKKLARYIKEDIPEIVGTEAVEHFEKSFENEGFTDSSLEKWKKPKRTKSSSSWYGFKYGSKSKRPGHKKRSNDSITNFSRAYTKKPTLSASGDLGRSISYKINGNVVTISSDKVYAKIHNEGGKMKVFGKGSGKMPKRQFMGPSKKLKEKILKEIEKDINRILEK